MTVRPPAGYPLPDLVLAANRALTEEANALRAAMESFSNAPQPGCPWEQDDQAVADHASPEAPSRAKLLRYTRHQATLIHVNAYDHLLTLARALGGDGSMPVFSHASVSRVVCEAAVRFALLMDPEISSEERIARGAAALYVSAEERFKGVRKLPAERFGQQQLRQMIDNCNAERARIQELINGAGFSFGYSRDGKKKVRLELESPKLSVPLDINVTERMAELLPDSPSWYNIGSSVAHSIYWGLRDVDGSRPGEPLALTPDVMDVGAAAESAISASELIINHGGRCFGHDPIAHIQRTSERREEIDALMRRAASSAWVRIPTE